MTVELVVTDAELTEDDKKALHRTIAGVTEDYQELRLNTVVAKLIEYVNYLTKAYNGGAPRAAIEPLVVMLAPIAPHIAEELWQRLGNEDTVTYVDFPDFEEKYLVDDEIELPVQVNGKVRGRIMVATDAVQDDIIAKAMEAVNSHIEGKTVVKQIVVPGRMVNLVVK